MLRDGWLNRIIIAGLVFAFLVGGYIAYTAVTLPNVRQAIASGIEPSQTSQVLGRDGSVIMAYGKYQHKPVSIDDIPETMIDALLATEDRRFYFHKGIDPIGILRAVFQNVRSQGIHEGGSTLTQQLARNIFLSNERSLERKVKEALLALKLEQQLGKKEILALYLNNVYFGEGAYGIGAASNIYFGKVPPDLTVDECALLAGLPQAPSLYSPFANPNLAKKRRAEVLDNLVETGKLSREKAERYKKAPLSLNPHGRKISSSDKAPFFNRYVIEQVLDMLDLDEQTFWQLGLKIKTPLDPRAQMIADTQLNRINAVFGRTGRKQQAALVSLDAKGGIIAYVGGKDFFESQFDRVSQARRPAGSLFKVFVYLTAIEHGLSPLTVYKDTPVKFGEWQPENYDKKHHGFMTLAQALVMSNNIIAVKLLNDMTPDAVIETAHRLGVKAPMQANLSLALGAADVTLMEMTTAFSTLSHHGTLIEPYAIDTIKDKAGTILFQHKPESRRIIQPAACETMIAMLQGVVKHGTGRGANIGRPVAGKTGTSDDYRDAWFIAFTPGVTTGVWVGNDNNAKMPGITGGSIPARIWRAYMSSLLEGMPKRSFELSHAVPLEDKDFFTYNLSNLSDSEKKPSQEELDAAKAAEEAKGDGENPDENQETYSAIDGQPQTPTDGAAGEVTDPAGASSGTTGAAPGTTDSSSPQGRTIVPEQQTTPAPARERFAPTSAPAPRPPRFQ